MSTTSSPKLKPVIKPNPDQNEWLSSLVASSSYGSQAMRGIASMGLGQGGKLLIQVLSTVILARMLFPADFGLVAMAATVTSFLVLFKDAGLNSATIQQTHLNHEQVSTLFWLNLMVGVGLAAVTAASAPVLAYVYGQPSLVSMVCVLAAGFLFSSLGTQHDALLRRRLRFVHISMAEVLALALGCFAAVIMAWYGFGWWALVAQKVVQMAAYTIFAWGMCNWRPGFLFNWEKVREQFRFGAHVSTFNFVNYFSRNGDNILIGWYWGASLLGIYAKAYDLLLGPLSQIAAPLSNMMTPLLGRLREEPARYRTAYLRTITPANLVMLPVATVMFVMPESVTLTLLGKSWAQAAPVIMWLALAVATQLIASSTGWILISQKRSRDYARNGFLSSFLTVASFVIGLRFGITAVAASYVLCHVFILQPVLYYRVSRTGPVGFADFYTPQRLVLWCAGFMLPTLLALRLTLPAHLPPAVQLAAACATSGLMLLLALSAVAEGRKLLRDTAQALLKSVRRK